MLSLATNPQICVFIHGRTFKEEALDFILAASHLVENIVVIFIKEGVYLIDKFKALKGFDINHLYAEKEALEENHINLAQCTISPTIILRRTLKKYVTHCQQIFAF